MYQKTVAALSDRVAPYVPLSNDRRETLGQLTLGLVSARTTNLSVLAAERIAWASTESTYRRYQRFFQFVELGEDWAAPVVAELARLEGPRTLILDRTNWKVGRRKVNLLMLAVKTRRARLGLMWTVLDRPGNSGAPERIALLERYIARVGRESIGLLLGDREFIGTDCNRGKRPGGATRGQPGGRGGRGRERWARRECRGGRRDSTRSGCRAWRRS